MSAAASAKPVLWILQNILKKMPPSDLPKGLKKLIQDHSPGKLTTGKFKGYRAVDCHGNYTGPTLKGITKLLETKLYSDGDIDGGACDSPAWKPTAWRGNHGGLRRGRAVDSQVSRLASSSMSTIKKANKYKYTAFFFSAIHKSGLEPILGQRIVISRPRGLATAADVVCLDKERNALVLVELKTGYSCNRTLPAFLNGEPQKMKHPCSQADDSLLNRHLAQLAVTRQMLVSEDALIKQLKIQYGIVDISGKLIYVCDRETAIYDLPPYFVRRGKALLRTLAEH